MTRFASRAEDGPSTSGRRRGERPSDPARGPGRQVSRRPRLRLCSVTEGRSMTTMIPEAPAAGTYDEKRDADQVRRTNASGLTPVVFIHGLCLRPSSWDPWPQLFEQPRHSALTPRWPDDP